MPEDNGNGVFRLIDDLIEVLRSNNQIEMVEELKSWQSTCFTTSSELIGELKLILKKINKRNLKGLNKDAYRQINQSVSGINKYIKPKWSFWGS